jgi:hypothetical protein
MDDGALKMSIRLLSMAACAVVLSACSSMSVSQGGNHLKPEVPPTLANTEMVMTDPVSAQATVHAIQVLGMTFKSGDAGKSGSVNDSLKTLSLDDLNLINLLFGSPVSKSEAISAARYNALVANPEKMSDALVETRVQSTVHGFSLLGILGYGTATATVDGYGVKLQKK